jgi:hypothetical protein
MSLTILIVTWTVIIPAAVIAYTHFAARLADSRRIAYIANRQPAGRARTRRACEGRRRPASDAPLAVPAAETHHFLRHRG